jgi:hypothetical protein
MIRPDPLTLAPVAAPALVLVMGVPVTRELLIGLGDVAIACKVRGVEIEAWLAEAWRRVER